MPTVPIQEPPTMPTVPNMEPPGSETVIIEDTLVEPPSPPAAPEASEWVDHAPASLPPLVLQDPVQIGEYLIHPRDDHGRPLARPLMPTSSCEAFCKFPLNWLVVSVGST